MRIFVLWVFVKGFGIFINETLVNLILKEKFIPFMDLNSYLKSKHLIYHIVSRF